MCAAASAAAIVRAARATGTEGDVAAASGAGFPGCWRWFRSPVRQASAPAAAALSPPAPQEGPGASLLAASRLDTIRTAAAAVRAAAHLAVTLTAVAACAGANSVAGGGALESADFRGSSGVDAQPARATVWLAPAAPYLVPAATASDASSAGHAAPETCSVCGTLQSAAGRQTPPPLLPCTDQFFF